MIGGGGIGIFNTYFYFGVVFVLKIELSSLGNLSRRLLSKILRVVGLELGRLCYSCMLLLILGKLCYFFGLSTFICKDGDGYNNITILLGFGEDKMG